MAKLPLLLALVAVNAGNQKPGRQVLSAVLAAHFLIACFMALGTNALTSLFAIISAGLAAACVMAALKNEVPWRVLPEYEAGKWAAVLAYTVAFLWPFSMTPSPVSPWAVIASPMAILPHLSLLVALIMLASTQRAVELFFAYTALAAALVIGGLEAFAGDRPIGIALLGVGGIAAWLYFAPSLPVMVDFQHSVAENPVPRSPEKPENSASDKKWNLK